MANKDSPVPRKMEEVSIRHVPVQILDRGVFDPEGYTENDRVVVLVSLEAAKAFAEEGNESTGRRMMDSNILACRTQFTALKSKHCEA